jgi:hypothetical protein
MYLLAAVEESLLAADWSPLMEDRSPLMEDRSPLMADWSPLMEDRSPLMADWSGLKCSSLAGWAGGAFSWAPAYARLWRSGCQTSCVWQ